jgi:hypothetical protein
VRFAFQFVFAFFSGLVALSSAVAADDFDPETVPIEDVISCKIKAPYYMGFIMTLTTDNEPGSWQKRGWKKTDAKNTWLSQYRLPAPITVFGHQTSDVAFTNSGMLAVLDMADPLPIAKENGIESLPLPGRFMGQKILESGSTDDKELGMKITTQTSLNVSTVASHPGKTLIGCSYRMDMEPLG